jgi:hypothetical protein
MPGSSESGAVPINSVIVPPVLPLELVVLLLPPDADDDEELDELPHAATATTEASVRAMVAIDRLRLLTSTSS